jgi:DNA-binding GntR family transcriptional regulator
MGRLAGASLMLIKNLEKLRKRTLRERICEEVVHLILSGELPSGGWLDEKQVIHKLRVSRTPFREAIGILAKGGLVEIRPYRVFMCAAFTAARPRIATSYSSGLNVLRSNSLCRK